MGLFRVADRWGERGKKAPLPKICHTYPIMMKLGIVIPYLKKIQKTNKFKFNNLGLALGMALKFYTTVAKRLN